MFNIETKLWKVRTMRKNILCLFVIIVILLMLTMPLSINAVRINRTNYIKTNEVYETNNDLPLYFSWRDIDGVDFTTAIRNQSPYPSCETFAIVGALETMVQYKVGYPFGCDFSEAHLFFYSNGTIDWGSYPENDTQYLVDYGIPDEACWPYPDKLYQYPLNTTSPDWQNRTVKITSWSYLPEDRNAIKEALVNNGPVPTYFHVYRDFLYHKDGIYRHRWGKSSGPHYVTIVGYNDDPGYWIVKNSWGVNYQDNGWFNIAYGECEIEKKSFLIKDPYGKFPILYVDDDNVLGPWDGTKEHPYNKIQDAIDIAYVGYTVFVKEGTYNENIVIHKTIKLDGENRTNTIINGNGTGHVIEISAPNVRVSGFTVQNSGKLEFDAGIKTLTLDSYVDINNNIVRNNQIGIFLNYAFENSKATVENNIIMENKQGIYSHWSNNNLIKNNEIYDNEDHGIECIRSFYPRIVGNSIKNNGKYGIYLRGSSNEGMIKNNEIEENLGGIIIVDSNKNKINKNNLINNDYQAYFMNSFFNKWRRNYWSDWPRLLPKRIKGEFNFRGIPWSNFDWLPCRNPNEF
jgi:parallel beta-helix repeat protein